MATLILVPGAWLGGWVWGRVAAELRARGHVVYTPTLTGLGDRRHLLQPAIDLEWHATDVVRLLEYEDLQRVTLVGHGYGGAVVQRVVARAPERVRRLVYLDALLGQDRASLSDSLGAEAMEALCLREVVERGTPVFTPESGLLLDGLPKRDADWVEDRLAPMPARPYYQRLDLVILATLDLPTIYVRCQRGDPSASLGVARALGLSVQEIDAGVLPMIDKVEPTAELLDNFVRQPAARFTRGGGTEAP